MEADEQELESSQPDLAGQAWLADRGELAGPLAHEFNNVLNSIVLHLAILEPAMPAKLRPDLVEIRKQTASVAALVHQFQEYRNQQCSKRRLTDINPVLEALVAELEQGATSLPHPGPTRVISKLAADLPPVYGNRAELQRLGMFLLTNAQAASPEQGRVKVRTERDGQFVLLHIEDEGAQIDPDLLPALFETSGSHRKGTNSLELAACRSIVRRLRGEIFWENLPGKGMRVTAKLRAASA